MAGGSNETRRPRRTGKGSLKTKTERSQRNQKTRQHQPEEEELTSTATGKEKKSSSLETTTSDVELGLDLKPEVGSHASQPALVPIGISVYLPLDFRFASPAKRQPPATIDAYPRQPIYTVLLGREIYHLFLDRQNACWNVRPKLSPPPVLSCCSQPTPSHPAIPRRTSFLADHSIPASTPRTTGKTIVPVLPFCVLAGRT